jgi:hypothetical protein
MKRSAAGLLVLVLALGGCLQPLGPVQGLVPDLRGTWTGTWAGTPLTLVVLDQSGTLPADGGIVLGPWPLFGGTLPALTGVLTFQSADAPLSVNVQGRFGDLGGRLALVLDAVTQDSQRIVLSEVTPERLRGTGTSRLRWQPQGPVELRINPATRSSAGSTASAFAGSRLNTSRATPASR